MLGAIIISAAINNFEPFPAADVPAVIGLLLLMIIWDMAVDVFKK